LSHENFGLLVGVLLYFDRCYKQAEGTIMISTQREKIQLQPRKVHCDCDGGIEIATAFKDHDEPLLFFIRRCVDMLDPKHRMEVVESYDGREEITYYGWQFRKVCDNGAKYLNFWFPCHIDSPHDCTGQICSDELSVFIGPNGLVVFMREYKYDV
jgi:hypothetical protein